jgi:peptidoglycan/xylan/chitin deacetylase (PgdA/CDA1 family)
MLVMKHRRLAGAIAFCLVAAAALSAEARSSNPAKTVSAVSRTVPLHFTFEAHPSVALTFDDLPAAGGLAPGETRTAILGRLAAELKASHLKGTYGFVTAADLTGDSDSQQALRIWVAAGMNLGNHTFSHPSLTTDAAAAFEHNIALDEPALRQYAGHRNWHWFRYPYLEEGQTPARQSNVRGWLLQHGYRIAEVTLNFDDDEWSDPYDRCRAQHNDAGIAWLRQSYLQNAAQFIRVGREEDPQRPAPARNGSHHPYAARPPGTSPPTGLSLCPACQSRAEPRLPPRSRCRTRRRRPAHQRVSP